MEKKNNTTDILTVAEARKRLPVVRPIVERLMAVVEEAASARENEADPARLAALQSEFDAALDALNAQGAILKDPERGLIDFYGWIDGEVVHLCWLHGEETVDWWHGVQAGFAGRTRIRADQAQG
jgi:hypothetical protein